MARRTTAAQAGTQLLIAPASLEVLGLGHVLEGEAVEVPEELAGAAPDPRYAEASAELAAARAANDTELERALAAELEELRAAGAAGRGLLARGWLPTSTTTTQPTTPPSEEAPK